MSMETIYRIIYSEGRSRTSSDPGLVRKLACARGAGYVCEKSIDGGLTWSAWS